MQNAGATYSIASLAVSNLTKAKFLVLSTILEFAVTNYASYFIRQSLGNYTTTNGKNTINDSDIDKLSLSWNHKRVYTIIFHRTAKI